MTANVIEMLGQLIDGDLAQELNENWARLYTAVNQAGKPGKLTLVLTLEPTGGKHATAQVGADVKINLPSNPLPKTTMYDIDSNGKMSREHPRQASLFAEQVIRKATATANVDEETGEVNEE